VLDVNPAHREPRVLIGQPTPTSGGELASLAPASRRLHELDESVLPQSIEPGWIAVIRPDRCVMAEGAASELPDLRRRELDMVEATPPTRLPRALPASA